MAEAVPPHNLDSPVGALARPKQAAALHRLGINTVRDLLMHVPYALDRYGDPAPIAALVPGQEATVVGVVEAISPGRARFNSKTRFAEAEISDGSGRLKVTWFNKPWLAQQLKPGMRVALAGRAQQTRFSRHLEMRNPHHEVVGAGGPTRVGGLMPKYHLTSGITSNAIADLVAEVLPLAGRLVDPLPPETCLRQNLLPLADAVRYAHAPRDEDQFAAANRRLQWSDVFELQAAFMWLKRLYAGERATPVPYRQEVIDRYKAGLAFELTHAQKRSAWEAFQDMREEIPMNRLVNGDVGSGKTAVAAACAAMAHAAGLQTVVMAPTEILARQHLHKFRNYLEESFPDLRVELFVSGLPAAERRRVLTAAASGHCSLLVGTQALIEGDIELAALGLAVVDEQHRFGTGQREMLRAKAGSSRPHFLAMTATPIPRTLALTVYGEMALSVVDDMPPGRTPVETEVITPPERERAYELVRREVRAGRQAFVICPLIEESEALEARAATVEYERLRTTVFQDLRVALVHGRRKDKDQVMREFGEGSHDVLVATAVVEVGVDVPNASVMLIEGAERFGLAQLHQFRGRVGRGAARSFCLLFADDPAEAALQRLRIMVSEHDGFRLAEWDMRMRGAGQLIGQRQHGLTDAAMRALAQPTLLHEAREEAQRLLEEDPDLEAHPWVRARVEARLRQTSLS